MSLYRALFVRPRLYVALAAVAGLFLAGHFAQGMAGLGRLGAGALAVLVALDALLLYRQDVEAWREMPERLSNGDPNDVRLHLENTGRVPVQVTVRDELPVQLQIRRARHDLSLAPREREIIAYSVRPTRRGAYEFGAVNVFARSALGLLSRRHRFEEGRTVPVYPSYQQMQRFELLAASDRLTEAGVKPLRRLGHTMEFDHIREYVVGDDVRTVNWKATARAGSSDDLMVNQYREERGQPVYCLLDMGRVMEMPFDEMTLLDHSINASLVLANIALGKQDRAGLVAFSDEVNRILPAARKPGQIRRVQEVLYNLRTDFEETDYARLVPFVRGRIHERSLLVVFTNFTARSSMQRQLPYLKALARRHEVLVIFFDNTELRALLEERPDDLEAVYEKAIAEKFALEKREIVQALRRNGLLAALTPPDDLTARTVNEYLALKARGVV